MGNIFKGLPVKLSQSGKISWVEHAVDGNRGQSSPHGPDRPTGSIWDTFDLWEQPPGVLALNLLSWMPHLLQVMRVQRVAVVEAALMSLSKEMTAILMGNNKWDICIACGFQRLHHNYVVTRTSFRHPVHSPRPTQVVGMGQNGAEAGISRLHQGPPEEQTPVAGSQRCRYNRECLYGYGAV